MAKMADQGIDVSDATMSCSLPPVHDVVVSSIDLFELSRSLLLRHLPINIMQLSQYIVTYCQYSEVSVITTLVIFRMMNVLTSVIWSISKLLW